MLTGLLFLLILLAIVLPSLFLPIFPSLNLYLLPLMFFHVTVVLRVCSSDLEASHHTQSPSFSDSSHKSRNSVSLTAFLLTLDLVAPADLLVPKFHPPGHRSHPRPN